MIIEHSDYEYGLLNEEINVARLPFYEYDLKSSEMLYVHYFETRNKE